MPSLITTHLQATPGRFERAPAYAVASGLPGTEFSRSPDEWSVYIEDSPGSGQFELAPTEIDWTSITLATGETGSKATVVVRALDASKLSSAGKLGTAHFKQLLEMMNINCRVIIAKGLGAGGVFERGLYELFSGYPVAGSASWSDKHQGIAWTIASEGDEWVKTKQMGQILGRIMRKYPFRSPSTYINSTNFDLIEVDALPPVFNAEGKANMLDQVLQLPNVSGLRVFSGDADTGAVHWHYANALRYVAAFYASFTGLDVQAFMLDTDDYVSLAAGGSSSDPFAHKMLQKVEGVSIASMSCFAALAALCKAGGLLLEIARRTGDLGNAIPYYLRVVAPIANPIEERGTRARHMGAAQAKDIPRDPPFTNYSGFAPGDVAARNAAQMAHLSADVRIVNAPVVVGGAMDHEVTFLLRPGWKPFQYLDIDPSSGDANALATAALTFWEDEFGEEDEERDDKAVPKSRYHTQHPNHAQVADIGRLWIFPDTGAYMKNTPLTLSDYKRKAGAWIRDQHYSPYGFQAERELQVYTDAVLGGGLPESVVSEWVLRRRPFGDLLSRANLQVADLAPRVEINFTDTSPETAMSVQSVNGVLVRNKNWIPFTGSVLIDKHRAALWIKEDNLLLSPKLRFENEDGDEFNYLEALIGINSQTGTYVKPAPQAGQTPPPDAPYGPHFFLRVTCTVRGDQRIKSRPTRTNNVLLRERSQVIDLGFDQFVYKSRIDGNSVLVDQVESDPLYQDRDDRAKLDAFARDKQKTLDQLTVGGDWEANYIETEIRLGDSFRGVDGLALDFATWPAVTAIEWSKDPEAGYRTKLHLDDLRHAPEVGAEV